MLELIDNKLHFKFPQVHKNAKMDIEFQRTFRVPDDGKSYGLPPGMGRFPVKMVDEYKDKLPKSWVEHGGVFLPMYQSEALWINFSGWNSYPCAVKIATGKLSALTAEPWKSGLTPKDYCVVPNQKWIDGYVTANGTVRQFVATPMGSGASVEHQITGKDEFGGIQIEVFPMKGSVYDKRFPPLHTLGVQRGYKGGQWVFGQEGPQGPTGPMGPSGSVGNFAGISYSCNVGASPAFEIAEQSMATNSAISEISSMSMGAGGSLMQQILNDPFSIEDWDTENGSRCFVHLTNSMVWRLITGKEPPTTPMTAKEYANGGYPWYDYYVEAPTLGGTQKSQNIKSVASLKPELLPENQSVEMKKTILLSEKPTPKGGVREGSW